MTVGELAHVDYAPSGARGHPLSPLILRRCQWPSKDGLVDLSEPWAEALGLAWEAMIAGTTPVGSVVTDADGQIVTRGRGRRYVRESEQGQLSYSHLAHAELNALAQLPPTHRHEGLTVLTTLEPCLLCMGAAVMATVGRVEYAGADPYGGAAHLELHNAHTARLMPGVTGPDPGRSEQSVRCCTMRFIVNETRMERW